MVPAAVHVKLENEFCRKIIYNNYPLPTLLTYSKRANREIERITESGDLILHTTDNLTDPVIEGAQIVLHWLQFLHTRMHGITEASQLTWELADTISRCALTGNFPLTIAKALRVQEAMLLLELDGGIVPQTSLKGLLSVHFLSGPIEPANLIAFFHIFAELDGEYTDLVLTTIAKRIWDGDSWPGFNLLWNSITSYQRMYERINDCYARLLAVQEADMGADVRLLLEQDAEVSGNGSMH